MTLTDAQTAAYEHARQSRLGDLTAQERTANALLDGASQTEPSQASRALHVAMYAARIGAALGRSTTARDLWMLGLLSVLAPDGADRFAVFAAHRATLERYRAGEAVLERPIDQAIAILRVAHTFQRSVEEAQRDRASSPADCMRLMLAQPDRFDRDVVQALRRALAGSTQPEWTSTKTTAA